jgi:CubicO group peptidase (beta-lactamase class C family)
VTDLDSLLLRRRVAGLLAPWNRPDSPGVTIGIVRAGALVLHESAGLASIEQGVPIGPDTTFRIASVSKQFTCAAILMLAEEGKLSLDDDIRLHVPELSDFGATVTIDHMMRNCSGIRDMLEIMRTGGTDLAMPASHEQLLAGIARQRTLNFPPGSRYLYSNAGFLLLGVIAERASGLKLRDFLARHIFAPCGMTMTRMVESTTELVPGLAGGYLPADPAQNIGPWTRAQHGFAVHGEGALVSSVTDLALWARACTTNRLGPNLTAQLEECAPFTNGRLNDYARGLRHSAVRGVATVSHGGLWPGYKTEFLRIPELDTAIIVIANNATANPYAIGQQILHHLLDGIPGVKPAPRLPDADVLARHAGRFLNPEAPATVDFTFSDKGTLTGSTNGVAFEVRSHGDGRLEAASSGRDFTFRLAADGNSIEIEHDAGVTATYHRVAPNASLPADLPGTYRSDEMAATWTITAHEQGMDLSIDGPHAKAGPWPLEGIEGDIVRVWTPGALYRSWLDARLVRDAEGRPTGLVTNGNRVKNLSFSRLAG